MNGTSRKPAHTVAKAPAVGNFDWLPVGLIPAKPVRGSVSFA